MPQDEVPLFAIPGQAERQPRQHSKADDERRNRVSYHRRSQTSAATTCDDCIHERRSRGSHSVRPAVYIRRHGTEEIVLCFEHKQIRQDQEWLERERGKQ